MTLISKPSAHDPMALWANLRGQKKPPVHLWNPPFCGDIDMRIGRDGTWYYMGSPIGRKPMVQLFASVLKREGNDYFLVTPVEKVGIKVDDAPFLAVEMAVEGVGQSQVLTFRTNVDDVVRADKDHPIRVEVDAKQEPSPYLLVRDGLQALIARAVFYDLVEKAVEGEIGSQRCLGVWSAGSFFAIDGAFGNRER